MTKRLYKRDDNKVLFGVASGVADYFGVSVNTVRLLWALLVIFSVSVFFWIYVVLAIVLPVGSKKEYQQADEVRRLKVELTEDGSQYSREDEIKDLKDKIKKSKPKTGNSKKKN